MATALGRNPLARSVLTAIIAKPESIQRRLADRAGAPLAWHAQRGNQSPKPSITKFITPANSTVQCKAFCYHCTARRLALLHSAQIRTHTHTHLPPAPCPTVIHLVRPVVCWSFLTVDLEWYAIFQTQSIQSNPIHEWIQSISNSVICQRLWGETTDHSTTSDIHWAKTVLFQKITVWCRLCCSFFLLTARSKHVYSPLGQKESKEKTVKNTVKHIQGQQSQALHIVENTNHKHIKTLSSQQSQPMFNAKCIKMIHYSTFHMWRWRWNCRLLVLPVADLGVNQVPVNVVG